MSEATGSPPSELALRLAKAHELLARGKQKQALKHLWFAEALARGREDALLEMLDVAIALGERVEPRRKSDLTNLIEVLQSDIETATRSSSTSPASPSSTSPAKPERGSVPGLLFGMLALVVVGAVVGAAIGGVIGKTVAPPDPNAFLDFGGGITGLFIGFVIGAIAFPLLLLALPRSLARRRRRRRSAHTGEASK